MMQRRRIFLVVLLLMFAIKNFGQNIPHYYSKGITLQQILKQTNQKSSGQDAKKDFQIFLLKINSCMAPDNHETGLFQLLNAGYFKRPIAFREGVLCRAEYKFQKATAISLRLRLGSLEYTNYLEQKPNALRPY